MFHLFGRAYALLAPRRGFLLALCALACFACALFVSRLVVREDISTMFPDDSGRIASDFALLRLAPFAQRLTITVSHAGANPTQAAETLATALRRESVFTRVLTGPPSNISLTFLTKLLPLAPALLTEQDTKTLYALTDPEHVQTALEQNRRDLLSPGAVALKKVIRQDPLGIRNIVLPKLAAPSRLADVRIENGHFVSRDGNHALILVDTDIPMTDSLGAAKVMSSYEKAVAALPEGAQAMLVGGHRHTHVNAQAIKDDLKIILPSAFILLALIFLLFMRNRQSLYVFLVPVCVVGVAGTATALVYGSISGIVLGFGAVLLGISVDYALHVYFALQNSSADENHNPAHTLTQISPAITFGALTSCTALAALLVSDIPGIRQLAVFSLFGIIASFFMSLLILPHFITATKGRLTNTTQHNTHKSFGVAPLITLWVVVLSAGIWFGQHTRINGDLRAMSFTPTEVQAEEDATRTIWGSMRDLALIFVRARTFDDALEKNDRVWSFLQTHNATSPIISLAPLLPAMQTQLQNISRWKAFWQVNGQSAFTRLETEQKALGFSRSAFSPFAEFISASPETISSESLHELGIQEFVDVLAMRDGDDFLVLTLLPDTMKNAALLSDYTERELGAQFVSGSRFRELLGGAMRIDVLRFSGSALAGVVLLNAILFRNPRKTLLALLPIGMGVTTVLAVMYSFGQALNLFHIVSLPLIIGLGADYGIFMVCRSEQSAHHQTARAVLFSGLTTLCGFGVLVLARHPALHSIGITVLTGVGTAMITALWIVPALNGDRR
ncbi:putative exporter [Desulfomicrobium macestii]|uniref:Exporter n=1 Tax=Desulfomicrobium macestii TaxID=90731 RepID=A0ABR9H7B4_9BACT|nr:MMPL family transporter [Desulfomicrobium macestii]MBE1426606.1 putative exporter [Desulfomicrobium macestii]